MEQALEVTAPSMTTAGVTRVTGFRTSRPAGSKALRPARLAGRLGVAAPVAVMQAIEQVARRGGLGECQGQPKSKGRDEHSLHLSLPFLVVRLCPKDCRPEM